MQGLGVHANNNRGKVNKQRIRGLLLSGMRICIGLMGLVSLDKVNWG